MQVEDGSRLRWSPGDKRICFGEKKRPFLVQKHILPVSTVAPSRRQQLLPATTCLQAWHAMAAEATRGRQRDRLIVSFQRILKVGASEKPHQPLVKSGHRSGQLEFGLK